MTCEEWKRIIWFLWYISDRDDNVADEDGSNDDDDDDGDDNGDGAVGVIDLKTYMV